MPIQPVSEWSLSRVLSEERQIPQVSPRGREGVSAGDVELPLAPAPDAPPERLHLHSVLNFVHVDGFGYVKDRRHVAGFRPHQFRQPPGEEDPSWKVETLELVGLVVHPEPVGYVSASLPRMDLLRDAPLRPLDTFENQGLGDLREGTELFVRRQGPNVRMLGAIRAARQCVACHDCERGTLLGAFSYTLRKE
jgi:hypothetical protein